MAPGDRSGDALTWLYGLPLPAPPSACDGEGTCVECGVPGVAGLLSILVKEGPLGDPAWDGEPGIRPAAATMCACCC